MASYYGYVEKKADSFVDWAQAAKGMTDMLTEQNKIREDKKTALDESFRSLSKDLTDNPLGESKQASDYSMQLAGDAQGYLLNLNKMLKSGQVKLNDYLTRTQNLTDSTKSTYDLLKVYQDRAKAVKERRAKGESCSFETKSFEEAEGFANFANTYAYINPETGVIWNAKMQKEIVNGKEIYTIPKTPTGELQPVFLLKKRMETNYDAFNMDAAAKNMANSFGDQIHVLETMKASTKHPGLMKEILDPMNREALKTLPESMRNFMGDMEKAETKLIEKDLVNPINTLSILLDQIRPQDGGFYDTTYDENAAAADPNLILIRNQGNQMVPDFSTENGKKQYQAAMDAYRLRLRMSYKYDEKATVLPQHSTGSSGRGGGGGSKPKKTGSDDESNNAAGAGEPYDEAAFRSFLDTQLQNALREESPETTKEELQKFLTKFGFGEVGTAGGGPFGGMRTTTFTLFGPNGEKSPDFSLDTGEFDYEGIIDFIINNADSEKVYKLFPPKKEEEKPAAEKKTTSVKGFKNPSNYA
jgi:hypothetical protein